MLSLYVPKENKAGLLYLHNIGREKIIRNTMKIRTVLSIAILLALAFVGCDKDEETIVPKYLIEAKEYVPTQAKFTIEGAKEVFTNKEMSELAAMATKDFKVYKLKYKTAFGGDSITVSGIVSVPIPEKKKDAFPVVSYQHQLVVKKSEAPSENIENEIMPYLASTGMVIIMPDYIGYGASKSEFHPYLIKKYTNNAVIDFIRAATEFLKTEKPCNINDYTFMLGYGQGGGATLGALSAIENDPKNSDIKITATSCANGLYNFNEFRKWLVKQVRFDTPHIMAFMLESFKEYSNVDVDYDMVFSPEFAPNIPGVIDGVSDVASIVKTIGTTHVGEMLNDNYEKDSLFNSMDEYATLRAAYNENSIEAWPVKSVVALYYGTIGKVFPSDLSMMLYQEFQKENVGASVKVKPLNGKDHETAFAPSIVESIKWFKSLSAE